MQRLGEEAADLENAKYGDLSGEQTLREILATDICESYDCSESVTAKVGNALACLFRMLFRN